jgi:4-cresol dehydrogenase (hydroxylating)
VDNWGIGPQLDGLFIQSNLAVVTSVTLWLAPRATHPQHFLVSVDEDGLPALIDSLRTIRHTISPYGRFMILNRYRYAAHTKRYPWGRTAGRTPLSPDEVRDLTAELTGDWTCVGLLHCASRLHRAAEVRLVRKALGHLAGRTRFLNGDVAVWVNRLWWLVKLLTRADPPPVVNILYDGKHPREFDTRLSKNQMYWRVKGELPQSDAPNESCGIYWYFATIPWEGAAVCAAQRAYNEIMLSNGFEPIAALRFPADRTALLAGQIAFDRTIEGEDIRARRCYEELVQRFCSMGYLPYRLGVQGMELLPPTVDQSAIVLQRIKRALDPSDVLSPGRYDARNDWTELDPPY